MRWPWQTDSDRVLRLLDAVLDDNRKARVEHQRLLVEAFEALREASDDNQR